MKKVLVVDDTKNIRTLLTKCLQREGFDVSTANDGYQALELFCHDNFDLAFLDIKMPNLSGTEVLKKIREKGIMTPVIIITAYGTVKNAVECTQMGAVAYLQKPFTADKVRNTLAELLNLEEYKTCEDNNATARLLIKEKQYLRAIELLKITLAKEPLRADTYLLLSKASSGLGVKEDEKKYLNIYNSITV